jgi:hypothetical protein
MVEHHATSEVHLSPCPPFKAGDLLQRNLALF